MSESFMRIDIHYKPNLEFYPDDVTSYKDAVILDIESIKSGEISLGEFLELAYGVEFNAVVSSVTGELDESGALVTQEKIHRLEG